MSWRFANSRSFALLPIHTRIHEANGLACSRAVQLAIHLATWFQYALASLPVLNGTMLVNKHMESTYSIRVSPHYRSHARRQASILNNFLQGAARHLGTMGWKQKCLKHHSFNTNFHPHHFNLSPEHCHGQLKAKKSTEPCSCLTCKHLHLISSLGFL